MTRTRQAGFVLVLTLWILTAIAIAAAYFGARVQASLRLAGARQDLSDALVSLSNARAEVLYRLAVTPMSAYGLGDPPYVIKLDGRVYAESGSQTQLQDAGGLINLNQFSDEFFVPLLGVLGAPVERHASLLDALRDYVDEDDLRRLNGAEAAQYRAAGKAGLPRNALLSTPTELYDVLGWDQERELWRDGRLLDVVTVAGVPRLNPNTAPLQMLMALPNVNREVAMAIIARREIEPVGADWLDRLLGTHYSGMPSPIAPFPQPWIRVTQRAPGLPWGVRYNVELTPTGGVAPWKINYFYRLENFPPDQGTDPNLAAQPPSSLLTPAHAPDPPRFPPRPSEPSSAPNVLAR